MEWMHLLLGPLVLVIALLTKYFPPKEINHIYGYRTARSMKSREAWEQGNQYAANALLMASVVTCLFQIVSYTLMSWSNAILTSGIFLAVAVVLVIPVTERYLKRKGF
jgi:uncharacterized membrane protein